MFPRPPKPNNEKVKRTTFNKTKNGEKEEGTRATAGSSSTSIGSGLWAEVLSEHGRILRERGQRLEEGDKLEDRRKPCLGNKSGNRRSIRKKNINLIIIIR